MTESERRELNELIGDELGKFLLITLRDLEGERAADIDESIEAHGETRGELEERFVCELGQHEAMDRSFIAMEHVDSYLLKHPYILLNPKAYYLASLASMSLAQLYQECGQEDLAEVEPKPRSGILRWFS
jgi:hypothetical protein